MKGRDFIAQLDITNQCRRYGVPLWECPQFLFVVMGTLIMISSIVFYLLGKAYIQDPLVASIVILVLTGVLLAIAFTISNSFERLAAANRMKTEFVSIVSHQLRSPLSNLTWAMEFLSSGRGGPVAKSQLEYFQILSENISRMRGLVNDLLIVSRIEQGTLPVKKSAFSFPDLVRDTAKEFEATLKASNIALTIQGDGSIPLLVNDVARIRQVLGNLLDNAIRYSWHSDGTVFASDSTKERERAITLRYSRKGSRVLCSVQDNGIGIPKEDQGYIFQKFFRSQNALRFQTQGSGLGLYIAKSIIEQAGGEIGFRSKEREGSVFWFTLPCPRFTPGRKA